jgi:hypothetical protein
MSTPVTASVPHRLGKAEAMRRLKAGLARARGDFGKVITIEHEEWDGDTLNFRMRALGQNAAGSITVMEDKLLIAVTLPWLLAKAAEQILPRIQRQATLLLEHK